MRIVFIGASGITLMTTRQLLKDGHEVVIIEADEACLEDLEAEEELDCALVKGDGSRPAVLEEIGAENTDFLFCLSDSDQDNIIASLVGRELGFQKIITQINEAEFEPICRHLNLENIILPDHKVAESLVDMVNGEETAILSDMIKGNVRFFAFIVSEELSGKAIDTLDLPDSTHPIVINRKEESIIVRGEETLKEQDEIVLITDKKHLKKLREQFAVEE